MPIGFEKTISQPYMCALMTDLLAPERHETVLEVGTGLGYQTAVLAELAGHVWSVEIVEELADARSYVLANSATPMSAFGSGTDRAAGPSMRHTTKSWLPPPPRRCQSAARAAETDWAPRHAPRPSGCATTHNHRQRCRRGRPQASRDTGKVQPARDRHVTSCALDALEFSCSLSSVLTIGGGDRTIQDQRLRHRGTGRTLREWRQPRPLHP